jgi:cytochrome P450
VPGNDVVSELLRPRREGSLDFLGDEELGIELVHFFLAGAPLQAALAYHLLHLAQYPEVTARAREEVQAVWPEGPADLARIRALTYVLRTCKESRRRARLVPNTFFGVVKNDLEIQGYRIPKGWKAMGLIGSTHHDPATFPDPETYNPDRFADQCPMYVAHGGDFDPHRCIGEGFADLVMTLLTARLLQAYTWELVPGQDLGPRTGKVAPVPAGGLQVLFRRLRPTQ